MNATFSDGRSREQRADIELKRGIVRDEEGKIVHSNEWKVARITHLHTKIEDFAQRTKNAKAEIKVLEKSM